MKYVRALFVLAGILALSSCGKLTPPLDSAERDALIAQLLFAESSWHPLVEYPVIDDDVWHVEKFKEQDGWVTVLARGYDIDKKWAYYFFVNGQLRLVGVTDRIDDNGYNVFKLYFLNEGHLVHIEEYSELLNEFYTLKTSRNDRLWVSRLLQSVPSEILEIVSSWQTDHLTHESLRTYSSLDLQHLADIQQLTGAARLLQDSEFIDAVKALCIADWRSEMILSWLASNPSVERLSDNSGFVIRGSSALLANGVVYTDIILIVEFSTGALFMGYNSSEGFDEGWYAQTRAPVSDVIIDIMRPYMPVEEYEYDEGSGY